MRILGADLSKRALERITAKLKDNVGDPDKSCTRQAFLPAA